MYSAGEKWAAHYLVVRYRCRRLLIRCEGPAPLRRRARRRAARVIRTSLRAIAAGRLQVYLNHLLATAERLSSRLDCMTASTLSRSVPMTGRGRCRSAVLGCVFACSAMLAFLPTFVLGPWMGVFADRWDRRKVLIATQSFAMILAFVFAILVQTRVIALWHVFVLATLLGIVSALDFPSTQAFIGDIAGMSRVREAIILNTSIFQVSRMIGPALAGWGIGYLGVASAFWINGVTFLAVIASLLAIRGNQLRRTSTGRPLQEFREGLSFLRKETRAQDLLAFSVMVTFFGISSIIILPAVVSLVLGGGADMLGFLLASSGAGALVGALVLTPLAQRP